MVMKSNQSHVFPRSVGKELPLATSGEGVFVEDERGRRYLDAASGVFVAILGHSPPEIGERIAEQFKKLHFAYTGDFANEAQERLASQLIALAPAGFSKLWLTTSGSTANEAALKLARHYHVLKGATQKTKVISRWHSYHGSTIGALSMTGAIPRRRPYEPYLLSFPKIVPPYCYRCPFGSNAAQCSRQCADDLETQILLAGPQYVSAVIVEPVAGGPLGALVSEPAYLRRIREICDRYDILMIVDEVVSGVGRCGEWFAIGQSGVIPDLITLGKGLGGGFVPIGALLVRDKIYDVFDQTNTSFVHGESFTGHVVMATAASATIDYLEKEGLVANAARNGDYLGASLSRLATRPLVGEVRGRGLLRGIELVQDKATKKPFDRTAQIGEKVVQEAAKNGVMILAGNAAADGVNGDTILIAPPYNVTAQEIDVIVDVLSNALDAVAQSAGIKSN